jgi:hypothetical protein
MGVSVKFYSVVYSKVYIIKYILRNETTKIDY